MFNIGGFMNNQFIGKISDLVNIGTYSFEELPEYDRYKLAALYMQSANRQERWECIVDNPFYEDLPHLLIQVLGAYGTSRFAEANEKLINTLSNGIVEYLQKEIDDTFDLISREKAWESESPYD
jgi:hypothetical protein